MTAFRTAIVTGAASGIGRSFAESLVGHGAAVGLIDISDAGLAAATEQIQTGRGRIDARTADVSVREEVERAVGELAGSLAGLDVVIHCAAILGPGHFDEQPADDFERVVRIDLLGTANVIRATLPALRASRGAVACLASTAAVHGWPALGAYSAAKFGVAGLCDAIRPELARHGVGLTTVFPLLIDTPLLAGAQTAPILRAGKRLPPQVVVERTLRALERRRPRVFIPKTVRLIAAMHGIAPSLLDIWGRRMGFERKGRWRV